MRRLLAPTLAMVALVIAGIVVLSLMRDKGTARVVVPHTERPSTVERAPAPTVPGGAQARKAGPLPHTLAEVLESAPQLRESLKAASPMVREFARAKIEFLPALNACVAGRIPSGTIDGRMVFKIADNDRTYEADKIEIMRTTLSPAERELFEKCAAETFRQSIPVTDNGDVDEATGFGTRFTFPGEDDTVYR